MKRRFDSRVLMLVLFGLMLAASSPAQGQLAKKAGGRSTGASGDSAELISSGRDPVLRFAVAHQHAASACYGYLYLSHDTMRFEVTQPENDKSHSFTFRLADMYVAGQWRIMGSPLNEAEFKFRGGGTYHFFHVRKSLVESGAKLTWADVYNHDNLVRAATNFDSYVDMMQAQEARLHPPPPPPSTPPTISLLEPSGADAGKVVDTSAAKLRLRGIASHASGISGVSVNGQTAYLKTLAPQTVEFDIQDVAIRSGASAIVILATATDKTQAQLLFTVNRAEVRIMDPAPESETADAAVKVRGMALGFREVERVEVAGTAAELRKRDGGDVEFEVVSVPLTVGSNTVKGFVSTRNGLRENFQVNVKRLPPAGPPALTLREVEKLLQDGVPPKRITSLVSEFGVDFALTDDNEKVLREAGADANLLLVVAKSKKK